MYKTQDSAATAFASLRSPKSASESPIISPALKIEIVTPFSVTSLTEPLKIK